MIRLLILSVFSVLAGSCMAQSTDAFARRLQQTDSLGFGRIQIVEHGNWRQLIAPLTRPGKDAKIKGYRVRIYFGNEQNADQEAAAIAARFREQFPGVAIYTIYEAPYFKVMVGNYLTIEEAIIMKGRVEGSFNKAFISREDIQVSKLSD